MIRGEGMQCMRKRGFSLEWSSLSWKIFLFLVCRKPISTVSSSAESTSSSKSATTSVSITSTTTTSAAASSSVIKQLNVSMLHILSIFGHGFVGIGFRVEHDVSFSSGSALVVINNRNVRGIDNGAEPFTNVIFSDAEGESSHVYNVLGTTTHASPAAISSTISESTAASEASSITAEAKIFTIIAKTSAATTVSKATAKTTSHLTASHAWTSSTETSAKWSTSHSVIGSWSTASHSITTSTAASKSSTTSILSTLSFHHT